MKIDATLAFTTIPIGSAASAYRFRLEPEAAYGIFCDSPGSRPGSFNVGIGLEPVVRCPGSGDRLAKVNATQRLYCDACGQRVESLPGSIGPIVPEHEATKEAIDAYQLDPQDSAIYLDVTREEIVALQAMLQRVLDDNPEENA